MFYRIASKYFATGCGYFFSQKSSKCAKLSQFTHLMSMVFFYTLNLECEKSYRLVQKGSLNLRFKRVPQSRFKIVPQSIFTTVLQSRFTIVPQ